MDVNLFRPASADARPSFNSFSSSAPCTEGAKELMFGACLVNVLRIFNIVCYDIWICYIYEYTIHHDTIRFIRDTLTECAEGRYYASTWVCFFCSVRALGCCHARVFRQNASQGLSLGACRGNALMLLPVCKFSMLKEFEHVWKMYLPTIGILRFGI